MRIRKQKSALLLACAALSVLGLRAGAYISNGAIVPADSTEKPVISISDSIESNNVVDEVIWVVGDEPILKSDVEVMKLQAEAEGVKWKSDPLCSILEQLAVQKLFLHQAALDSIKVSESEISQQIDQRINYWIALPQIGSKEKLEEYQHKTLSQIRQDLHDDIKNMQLVQKMQESLIGDVKISPAEVREYIKNLPADSIPLIPTTVEVQIITQMPKISPDEVNRIKNQLRDYTERVNKGETSLQTLARLYSEDTGSARQGGELGYMGRGMLDPAFAAAAFNLTDPKKLSKVVESEFGYHIIQFIDRRGDKINCRHILIKPRISQSAIDEAKQRLDSIADEIRADKYSFDVAAAYVSDDKDTRNNNGLMVNSSASERTSRFKMKDLPTEVARIVDTLKVGEVSRSFQMVNDKGKTLCAIVKLKSRTPEHRATITEDFQEMKNIVIAQRRQKIIHDWVEKKVKDTYVRINPRYRTDCKFEYEGWVR